MESIGRGEEARVEVGEHSSLCIFPSSQVFCKLEEACIVLEQLTSALAYIHALGLLHRDIKPANILLILRALEKDPHHRYQTIEDLLHAFQMALDAPTFLEHLSTQWQETCQKPALTWC